MREVPHHQIDLDRWDRLVEASPAATVFHRSDYLSTVAPGWRALVASDYEFAMPLPVKRIGTHRVVAQPVFTREAGIISLSRPGHDVIRLFAARLTRFPEVHLAVPTVQAGGFQGMEQTTRTFQLLEIARDADDARSRYSADTRRLLKSKAGTVEIGEVGYDEVVDLWERTTFQKLDEYRPSHIETMRSLLALSEGGNWGFGVGARQAGELVAAGWFLRFRDQLLFLLSGMTDAGRRTGAMAFMFDALITRYADGARELDFMGSSIPSIARYFRNFGSDDREYVMLTHGRSPAWLRLARAVRSRLVS